MTQEEQLLKHFETVDNISADEARNVLLIRRLSAVILRLKHRGYGFTDKWLKDSTGRAYKRYYFIGGTGGDTRPYVSTSASMMQHAQA